MRPDPVTLIHCVDVYRGSKSSAVMQKGHNSVKAHGKGCVYFDKGASMKRGQVERLFHFLVNQRILVEKYSTNKAGFVSGYLEVT